TLAAGQHRDRLLDMRAAKEQSAGDFENLLVLFAKGGLLFEIAEDRLFLRQAGVDVLGVNPDLAAEAPADIARERLERIDHGAEKRGFTLAVIADDRCP